jgi:hypothetical protein
MNDTTKQVAKQMAAEPWEILKEARRQVIKKEDLPEQPAAEKPQSPLSETGRLKEKDKQLSARQMEALNREMADIVKDKLLGQLQEKIAAGEEVFLEEYPQLSAEQKQVLQAQIEAVRARQVQTTASEKPLVQPASKKGRRLFNFGQKTQVERQKTHVERPLPPSG